MQNRPNFYREENYVFLFLKGLKMVHTTFIEPNQLSVSSTIHHFFLFSPSNVQNSTNIERYDIVHLINTTMIFKYFLS